MAGATSAVQIMQYEVYAVGGEIAEEKAERRAGQRDRHGPGQKKFTSYTR